jgi:hypothetical protein
MRHSAIGGVLGVLGFLSACGPSPDPICRHYADVKVARPRKGAANSIAVEDLWRRTQGDCEEAMERLRQEDAPAYDKLATCITLAEDVASMNRCEKPSDWPTTK